MRTRAIRERIASDSLSSTEDDAAFILRRGTRLLCDGCRLFHRTRPTAVHGDNLAVMGLNLVQKQHAVLATSPGQHALCSAAACDSCIQ